MTFLLSGVAHLHFYLKSLFLVFFSSISGLTEPRGYAMSLFLSIPKGPQVVCLTNVRGDIGNSVVADWTAENQWFSEGEQRYVGAMVVSGDRRGRKKRPGDENKDVV